jgi:hypothetical protein
MSGRPPITPRIEAPRYPLAPEAAPSSTAAEQVTSTPSGRRRSARWLLAPTRLFARVPRVARMCALLATLSAACWSVITPPFEAPDEPAHFAYVQQLAETGQLPTSREARYSAAEEITLQGVLLPSVLWHPENHTVSTPGQQQRLQEYLTAPLSRIDAGDAGVATSEPPLFYAIEVLPYDAGSGGNLLDSLALMRLVSALMAGFTALFVYMFVREAIPGVPWAWAVGGLSAALAPLLGFMSGVVNPDALLYTVSAATFFCLARGFRRGLTPPLVIALGAVVTAGLLTKVNYLGLLPGVGLGAILLIVRALRDRPLPRRFYVSLAIAIALPGVPVGAYIVNNLLSGNPGLGLVSSGLSLTAGKASLFGELRYLWEFYLPRLPGMADDFHGIITTRDIWFNRWVGLYGWLDTSMPSWVDTFALIPAALLAALGVRSLLSGRAALRRRLGELCVYASMALGLMVLLGSDSYINAAAEGAGWAQPRYLMPLLSLGALSVALAVRGAGRRWGPVVGTVTVTLVLAHDIFSQLQTIARFYG